MWSGSIELLAVVGDRILARTAFHYTESSIRQLVVEPAWASLELGTASLSIARLARNFFALLHENTTTIALTSKTVAARCVGRRLNRTLP